MTSQQIYRSAAAHRRLARQSIHSDGEAESIMGTCLRNLSRRRSSGSSRAPLILYDARCGWRTRCAASSSTARSGRACELEPEIEVEYVATALDFAARGLGDTIAARASGRSGAPSPGGLRQRRLRPPLYDTFAFITRRNAQLSPATRAFVDLAAQRIDAMGSVLGARRARRLAGGRPDRIGRCRTTTRPSPRRSTSRRSSGSRRPACR